MIVYCNPVYTGRQEALRLVYEVREVKEHLKELSTLDRSLLDTDQFCEAISALNVVSDKLYAIRRVVSADTISDLQRTHYLEEGDLHVE